MTALETMEILETIMDEWQAGNIDSEEALAQITAVIDEL